MPTIIRQKRKRLLQDKRYLEDLSWRFHIAMASPEVKRRISQPRSQTSDKLLNALSLGGTPFNRVGCVYDKETGELLKIDSHAGLGANVERKEYRQAEAIDMRTRYRAIWGKRGYAKRIAHLEGKNVRTIQKYMKDFP